MAITKNTVLVNNGNTGWTRSNVLDALEETFADLNWNSGSQQNGVVTTCCYPGDNSRPWNDNPYDGGWLKCGGPQSLARPSETIYYQVTDDGTSYTFNRFYFSTSGSDGYNYVIINANSLSVGDALRYEQGDPAVSLVPGTLSGGETVYISFYDVAQTQIKLHLTETDAINGTNELNLQNTSADFWFYSDNLESTPSNIQQGDYLSLHVYGSDLTNPLYIQDSAGVYDSSRLISETNYNTVSYRGFPSYQGIVSGSTLFWTRGWQQGDYYITSTNASYSVAFTIAPGAGRTAMQITYGDGQEPPYWDYTVPASGTRSALNLRVYRGHGDGYIYGVKVLNLNSSGWSDSDTFTIPGDQIGGVSPANDLTFGVNTPETGTNFRDGIPSVRVVNIGSGVNSYLKMPTTNRLMVRIEHDGTKTYGTTHWLFEITSDYQLQMRSGINPNILNWNPNSATIDELGRYGGVLGLDISVNQGDQFTGEGQVHEFASSSTSTAYPLKIVTYKAQAPQDTNFAIIQFIQTVNGDDLNYLTFFLNKGTAYGNGIWDLEYVSQGTYSYFGTASSGAQSISIFTKIAQRNANSESPNTFSSVKRDAFYGYLRQPPSPTHDYLSVTVGNSLYSDNVQHASDYGGYYSSYGLEIHPYFRQADYDDNVFSAVSTIYGPNKNDYQPYYTVDSNADYYRPIKGIPLATAAAPVPYYLPDDFVAISVNITPGLAQFRPGDTVTISPSEVYEVVYARYANNGTTYDGIASNSTYGTLFCARIV
jgi:hypothetical protein